VVHLLVNAGVPPERLSAVGYGEFHPVVPNTTPDGRNANRRVVLSVEAGDTAAQ
jgi:chemotaxis protein MotB